MRQCSQHEPEAELAADSVRCGPFAACFRARARAAGALMPTNSLADHLQVRQGEQHDELRGVLGQASIAHLGVAELALDHPKDARLWHAHWP